MRKRQLIIDTQFSEVDQTEIRQNQDDSKVSEVNHSFLQKQQAIYNYMLMDLYYQGVSKIQEIFNRNNIDIVQMAFNRLKVHSKTIGQRNLYHRGIQNNQINQYSSRKKTKIYNDPEPRQSQSLDKMNFLNNIADRIIQTKRIKSESKNSSRTYISNKQGKKILSKLDKLQRMIKDIKKQTQMSNQASVVYVSRNRYPEQFITEDRLDRRFQMQNQIPLKPPTYTPLQSPIQGNYYQPFSNHHNRYYTQYRHTTNGQPFDTIPPFQNYVQRSPVNYQYDNHQVFKKHINQRPPTRPPTRIQYFDDEYQEYESQASQIQPNNINEQVRNLKQQLNELKKINAEYINKNIINEEETKMKQKKYSYQNELPQRVEKPNTRQKAFIRKQSIQRPQTNINRQYPYIPQLDLKRNLNNEYTQKQQMRNNYEQQIQQQKFFSDRRHHTYHQSNNNQFYPQFMTQKQITQQYVTPINIKHNIREASNNICGQCGCRCAEHSNPRQTNFKSRRYQL